MAKPAAYLGPELIEAQRAANRQIREQGPGDLPGRLRRRAGGHLAGGRGRSGRLLAAAAHTADLLLRQPGQGERNDAPDCSISS